MATITPYIATASQKITLIRFLEVILGALIAAPIKLLPVMYIPQAAPRTETPMDIAIPIDAKVYGEICVKARDHELEDDIFD